MRRDPETRIRYAARNEIAAVARFIKQETDAAETLSEWCRISHFDLPDDEYRAVAFFRNAEYKTKRGSLALLYETRRRLDRELPHSTKETAVDITRYRFKVFCAALQTGGFA